MTFATFQRLIDRQLGSVGRALGQQFTVYRVTPASSGHFPDGWTRISTQFRAHRNRVRSQDAEVSQTSERALWYEITGDVSPFWLGDVFLQTDGAYFPGIAYGVRATGITDTIELNGFALAWHPPIRPPIASRIDRKMAIYRPLLSPEVLNGASQWRAQKDQDTPLVLVNGVYTWGTPGTPASWVPAGLSTSDRQTRGEDMPPDPPGMLPVPRYYTYLPPLPGYTAAEGDALVTEDDARYTVISPYRQDTGVVGSQLMTQRYISQTT